MTTVCSESHRALEHMRVELENKMNDQSPPYPRPFLPQKRSVGASRSYLSLIIAANACGTSRSIMKSRPLNNTAVVYESMELVSVETTCRVAPVRCLVRST